MGKFDVAIVGGGVIGTAIAFELAAAKLRVVILDRQEPGREASWAAAGMLSPTPDSPRDIPLAPLSRESLALYPQFVAAVEEASGKSTAYASEGAIEVLFPPHGESARDHKISEYRRLGLAAEPIPMGEARRWEKFIGRDARAAISLPAEGTVEPRLLFDAVLAGARARGVEVCQDCGVTGLAIERDRCLGVVAGGERISAGRVVIAAGCFSRGIEQGGEIVARYAPTHPVRGQMLALRPDAPILRRVVRSDHGYLVPRRDGRIVAGSTTEEAGFEKRVTPQGLRQIFGAALELCPELSTAAIVETWSGLRPGTPDDLPILGPTDIEGLLIATGHYRNGILLSAVTAKLMREWIVNGRTEFKADAFSPLRFSRDVKPRSAAQRGD